MKDFIIAIYESPVFQWIALIIAIVALIMVSLLFIGMIIAIVSAIISEIDLPDRFRERKIKKSIKPKIFKVYKCNSCGEEALWEINDEKICPYCNKVIEDNEVKE